MLVANETHQNNTVSVNDINIPIKRYSLIDFFLKIQLYAAYKKTHYKSNDVSKLKVKGWKLISHASTN